MAQVGYVVYATRSARDEHNFPMGSGESLAAAAAAAATAEESAR